MPGSIVDHFGPLSYGIREYRCPTQELHDPAIDVIFSRGYYNSNYVVCKRCLKRMVLDNTRKRFYSVDFHIVEFDPWPG